MTTRPQFFISQAEEKNKSRSRPAFFTSGRIIEGLPPRGELTEEQRGPVLDVGFPSAAGAPGLDLGSVIEEENAYLRTREFQEMFLKYAQDPESLGKGERQQVEIALDLFPQLKTILDGMTSPVRPDSAISQVTVEEGQKGLEQFTERFEADSITMDDADVVARAPVQYRQARKLMLEFLGGVRRWTDKIANDPRRFGTQPEVIRKDLQELYAKMGLEATDPDEAFHELTDPAGTVIGRFPKSKSEVAATNFFKGLARVPGEVLTELYSNPVGFIMDLPAFVGGQLDLVVQAAFGTDIIMNDEGDIGFRGIDEQEQERVVKELITHPHGPVLAAMLFSGTLAKALKTGRIITTHSVMDNLVREFDVRTKELQRKDQQLTEAVRRQQDAERRVTEKKERRPLILDESLKELEAIEKATDGELRSELQSMQKDAVDKLSPVDIAKMDIEQVKFILSRGELGVDPSTIQIEPVERGTVKLEEGKPSQEGLKFGEEADVVTELKTEGKEPIPEVTAEKEVTKTREGETAAKILKIRYNGQQELTEGRTAELFTDPKTGTTFAVTDITEVAKKLQEVRLKDAEARLTQDQRENEQRRLELQRRQREIDDVSRETSDEVERLQLEIAETQDRVTEMEKTRAEFEEVVGDTKGAERKNVEAAIESITEQIARRNEEVDALMPQLREARRQAQIAPDKAETDAATRNLDEKREAESEIVGTSETSSTPEQAAEQKADRVKKVNERKEAEERVDEIQEDAEAVLDAETEAAVEQTKSPEAVTPVSPGLFEGKKQFKLVELDKLEVDTERFQGRFEEFSEESVNSIVEDVKAGRFDPDNFDPIHVWRDPESGKSIVLAGHSRLEALRRLEQTDVPVVFRDFKTEAEAIQYATELSNRLATAEGLRPDVRAYRQMRERGATSEELKARFGENTNYYDAFSYLNPGGKIMEIIEQRTFEDFPHAKKWARSIGELRKEFPQLINAHEQQIWDQLFPRDKGLALYDKMNKAKLLDVITAQVSDVYWTPEMPIKLKYDPKPMVGPRARRDTGPLVQKLDELEALKAKVETVPELERIDKEIRKIKKAIGEVLKNQTGLELGFFGVTPKGIVDLWIMMDRAITESGGQLGKVIERAELAEELKAGFEGGLESLKQHHRNLNSAKFYEQVMAKQFGDLIKSPARRQLILDMLQIEQPKAYANHLKKNKDIIIDAADYSIDQLTLFEQGILEWLKKERDRVEDFKIKNELVTPRKLPPGVRYGFQWWINEETGKPFGIEYGRFTKSLPQAKQRTFMTYLEGRLAGKKPVTDNVGLLIGKDFEMAMRAHAGRELYKTLHDLELGTGQKLADVAEIAEGIVPGETEIRPAMFLENWLKAKESALADEYTRLDLPFLEKPIKFKDSKGKIRTLEGPVAVHNSIFPWVQAYFDKPSYNKIQRVMMFAKSMKLAGIFHATQLGINDLMMGRFPIKDIIKGRRIKYDINDPAISLLVEEGLKVEGYEDLGFDPVKQLEFEGKGLKSQIPNFILKPIHELAKFTFHTVGNNMKVAVAYDNFHKLLPRWEAKVGPELTIEQARRNAARDAVRFADNLFSHEDWRMAMLESGRNMVKFYYSTTARSTLHALLISPQWQKQHIQAFTRGVKSLNPVSLWHDIRNGLDTPSANLYRRYMAGIAASFAVMDMYNYTMTQYMDGEGKHVWQNPEGHRFHVRAPFNHPDKTTAYIRPFKTAFEIPEALAAASKAAFNVGQNILGEEVDFDVRELSKFTSKLNPWWAAAAGTFVFNVDQFGNRIYEKRGLPERIADFTIWTYEPITLSQFAETAKRHKAPIGAVLSVFGFPVSKGYPGGKFSKMMSEIRFDNRLTKQEKLEIVDSKIIAAMNGDDEQLAEALLLMQEELNMGPEARANRVNRHWNRLIHNYEAMGPHDKGMFYLHLQETGQLEEFLEAIEKDLGD